MNRLIKFYNQNRYMIWLAVLVLVAIISLIQILDNLASEKIKVDNKVNENIAASTKFDKNYSVTDGIDVEKKTSQIIDEFITYCNKQEIKKAYELLSDECKEALYPTLDTFTKKYYNKLFKQSRTYMYQAWMTNNNKYTYKVEFMDNMLATGVPSSTSISDYYTVVKNNEEYKLNINKFIGMTDIKKVGTKDNVTIIINRKKIYMDYEIYEVEIQNNSSNEIILDNLQRTDTVYLEDDNQQKYYWYSHEMLEDEITIAKLKSKVIEIKFDNVYGPKNNLVKIIFSKIISGKKTFKIEILL